MNISGPAAVAKPEMLFYAPGDLTVTLQKQDYKGIWIYAEHRNGKLDAAVYELLGKAQELKAFCKEEITAVLLGNNVSALSDELIACGADRVIIAEDPALAEYRDRKSVV